MRVAYIVELDAFQTSGVLKKITSQVDEWNHQGVDAKLFLISKPPRKNMAYAQTVKDSNTWVHYNLLLNLVTKLIRKKQIYLNKIFTSFAVKNKIKEFNPDIIYYRWGIWFPGQLFRFGKYPVIVELNTNDLNEFKRYDKLTKAIHYSTRKWLLSRADGFCSVTEEISRTVALNGVQGIVIGNGVNTKGIQPRAVLGNKRTQIIFVGSSDCEWYGIDKIFTLAGFLTQYDFHIVGPKNKSSYQNLHNIIFHGFLDNEKLSQLYEKIDIAIGTIALHRNNMEEASPLKAREYVAYGLPVIIGYNDTDLNNESFVLNIGNYENNVADHIDHIVKFIETWKDKVIKIDYKHIDMNHKEKQRLGFFGSFVR